jgi:hypothetical protein
MSGDPGYRFDRWKVDLVGTFFGVLPDMENDAVVDSLEGEEEHENDVNIGCFEMNEHEDAADLTSFGKEKFKIEVVTAQLNLNWSWSLT